MTTPIIYTDKLPINPHYEAVNKANTNNPNFRKDYNGIVLEATKIIRNMGYKKLDAEHLATQWMRQFTEWQKHYKQQPIPPGAPDLNKAREGLKELKNMNPDDVVIEYWRR